MADTDIEVAPVDMGVTVPTVSHAFCFCQWPQGPGVATAICGQTLAIEGKISSKPRCPDCDAMPPFITCPHCKDYIRTR